VKIYLEKQSTLGIPLITGCIKYWPITCPGKEVIFINEIEEVIELLGSHSDTKFDQYGVKLLKQLLKTAQGMHYPAAERSLMLLNSDLMQRIVKANVTAAYPIVVKGLLRGSQTHWN
jgi:serine/threonine-protein phosphatase 2A regulatory subunit B'